MKYICDWIIKMSCAFRRVIEFTITLLCIYHTVSGYGSEEHGPRFVVEPPVSVFFSNATGARVECAAEGTPRPLVRWQLVRDGSTVSDVRDLMHVDDNGTLVFLPFAEHDYTPNMHMAAYRCVAHSSAGTIVSRNVQVKAEVIRKFEPVVRDTVTMPGNAAVFSCHIPGLKYDENNELPESVAITSWVQDSVFNIFPSWETDSKIIMVPKTGQLRISNVEENDLRHTYTCRIVNKLTGFTQESSTFGRIYFESNRTMAPWSKSKDNMVHLVKQGDHLLLPCDVYAFPPPKITWSSGTSTVVVTADTTVSGSGRSKASMNFLCLRSAQRTDAGNYTCTARNEVGYKSLEHQVIVIPDMSAHVVPALAEIESGRSVSFTCITSTADDNQIVIWLKDGVPRQSSSSTPPTYTLNVDSVQKDDQGMYQCVVTNKLNNEMAHSFAELRLSASKPTLKYKFIGHLLKPGPDVSLKCIASGTPTPHITWKFDGNDVPLSQMRISVGQYVTEVGDVVSHFNISKVQVEDGGMYECIVSNRAGQVSHSAKLQVYGDPVAKKTPKIIVRAGQQLQMACPITGYPIFNIIWEKDNKRLSAGKSLNKRHKVFANGSIIIENIQKKTDQGTYYCEASNDKHVVRASIEVTIIAPPHIHPFTIEGGHHEGGRVGWQCFITKGDGPLNIQWLKNNQSLDPAHTPSLSVTSLNEYSSSVLIESIRLAHEGNYTCRATNPVATVEHTVTLTVLVPPEWLIEPKDINVVRDDQTKVNCSASGHPKPTIKWKKGTNKDSDQFNDVMDNVTSDGTLVINKVTKKHEGFYMCEANNDVGTPLFAVIRLKVQDLPHIILPNTKYTSINGGVASMSCEATGDQPIHISWIKGSVQLNYKTSNLRYNVEEMYTDASVKSKLIISKVSTADSGRYVCVAENSLGKHEAAMELEIKGLGSPPDDLSCNVTTPNSVRLRWTDLNSNNLMNDYVQGYVLTYSKVVPPDDLISEYNEIEVFHDGDDATISNLDIDTEYVFSIKVNTNKGPGKSSKPLVCRTSESIPEPPAGLKCMLLSSNIVLITWIPPKQPNGEIQHYTLYEKEKMNGMQGTVKKQIFESHIRQIQMPIFRHSSSYLWWITATNDVGESGKSRVATLPTVKSGGIPAAIGNFHDTIQTKWRVNIDIPCITSGIPPPNVKWDFNGQPVDLNSQHSIHDNFTLHLESVTSEDTGNYTCTVWNIYGTENVTTSLQVIEPPKPPIIGIENVSWTNITVNWTKAPNTYAVQQYLLSYKYLNEPENMYTEIVLPPQTNAFTLPNIKCGTTVTFSISASNRVGHGMQSKPFNVKTLQGKMPAAPSQNEAIEQMASGFLIHLQKWNSKYCPIIHFSVYKKLNNEKEWTTVNENISPNGIYSIDNLNPATNYDILIKCINSAGMSSTMYTASTLKAYGGNYDKEALSVNDKIMNTIYKLVLMWPFALILISFIIIGISLIICYKYRHMYKKNQRHLESNNMILRDSTCTKSEVQPEIYETCTPFKSKSTLQVNEDPNYNEISPYATFQISPSKSPKRNKQYFCTNCGEDLEVCNCGRMFCSQTDYTNFLRRPIPKRVSSYPDNNNDDSKSHCSLHEFYEMERNANTCEPVKKPKRRLLPLPHSRRGSNQSSRDCRNTNLHETTFMMPIQHQHHHGPYSQNDTDDEDNTEVISSSRGSRPVPYRVCY